MPFFRRYDRWLLLLVATFLPISLVEGLSRAFGWAEASGATFSLAVREVDHDVDLAYNMEDPELLWTLRPGFEGGDIRVNALGLRGGDVPAAAPPGVTRILALGDSSTFGWQVREEETWPSQLQALLVGQGHAVSVLNAGVTGYTSTQGLMRYLRRLRPMGARIVVAWFGVNDPIARYHLSDWDIMALQAPVLIGSFKAALLRSHTYLMIRRLVRSLRGDDAPRPPIPRVSPERFRANLLALHKAVSADGARLVLVSPTVEADRAATWERADRVRVYRSILRITAEELGIPLLELPSMIESAVPPRPDLFLDVVHPSPAGHGLVAGALARLLTEAHLLP